MGDVRIVREISETLTMDESKRLVLISSSTGVIGQIAVEKSLLREDASISGILDEPGRLDGGGGSECPTR
ncbi:hypothetical protein PENTCL1PPCAC_27569, partial [Pristionchus entomophagus]